MAQRSSSPSSLPEQPPNDQGTRRRRGVAEAPRALEAPNRSDASEMLKSPRGQPFPNIGWSDHLTWLCEKLIERGTDSFGDDLVDHELLAMILLSAHPKNDTKRLAKATIKRFGSFAAVLAAPTRDLLAAPGLGLRVVAMIKLVQASAARLIRAEIMDRPILTNSHRVLAYLHAVMARSKVQQFRVLFLDSGNRLISDEAHGPTTTGHAFPYPREVVKRALELRATALILAHNHPSGDPSPTAEDLHLNKDIRAAAGALGIVLHDHLIIGNGRWISLSDSGYTRQHR